MPRFRRKSTVTTQLYQNNLMAINDLHVWETVFLAYHLVSVEWSAGREPALFASGFTGRKRK